MLSICIALSALHDVHILAKSQRPMLLICWLHNCHYLKTNWYCTDDWVILFDGDVFFCVLQIELKSSMKELNMFHNYETEKITHKASDVAENLQLYRVVWFFCPRSSCTTRLMLFSECLPIYASCMTILGGRTK